MNGAKSFLARHGWNDCLAAVTMLSMVDISSLLRKDQRTVGKDGPGPYHQQQGET